MTRSQDFIWKQRKTLSDGSLFFNPDTTYMSYSEWDKKPVHFLLIFPTPAEVKTVSSTAAALNDQIQAYCPNTYIDFAYIPNGKDIQLYDKAQIPYCIGINSHLDASHFEIVGFSISVLCEVIGMATIIDSFKRCDKPISLTWTERKDLPLGDQPIIMCGGITAACGDIMYGDLGDGRQAFADFTYLGEDYKMNLIFNRYEEALKTHVVHRKQEDREWIGMNPDPVQYDDICENVITHQDFIDTLFDLRWIYQPQAYEVKMNDKTQIVSNKKINPKAQDWVKPIYPHELPKDLGIGRSIINSNGDNCGVSQVEVSNGCSAGGCCSFCSEGTYSAGWVEKSHEEILKEAWESKKYNAAWTQKLYSFNCVEENTLVPTLYGFSHVKDLNAAIDIYDSIGRTRFKLLNKKVDDVYQFNCSQGPGLMLTRRHKQFILTSEGLTEVEAKDIKVGDWIPQRIGYFTGQASNDDFYYYLGLWYGDGYYGGNSTYIAVNKDEIELQFKVSRFALYLADEDEVKRYLLPRDFTVRVKEICPYKDKFSVAGMKLNDILSFTRGLFDADGCGSGGYLKITQKESRVGLLRELSVVLGSVGIRTRLSKITKVKVHGVTHCRRDLYVVGLESRKNFILRIGSSLKKKIQDVSTYGGHSVKDKCLPGLFGEWTYNELKKIGKEKSHNCSKWFNGKIGISVERFKELFSNIDIVPSRLFNQGIRFVQVVSIEDIGEKNVVDVVGTERGEWIANGYITHNCNYVTDYKGLLYELMKIYPRCTFINMRMQELGHDPDALKMMKLVGSNRLSAPLEGMSPRVMNNFMNKCLDEEAIENVMGYAVHGKMMDVKIGGIFSCYEEDQDYQWMCDFFDKYNQRAQKEGGNFTGRLKMCLTEEALTPFIGKGLVRQKDLFIGQLADAIGTSEVLKVLPQGECKIWKLITTDGTVIRGTGQHPLLVNPNDRNSVESFKFLQDIKQGDKIYARVGTEIYGGYQKFITDGSRYEAKKKYELSEDLAKVFGWYMGDGYLNMYDHQKTFGFCFNKNEQEIYNELWEILVNYGLSPRVHAHKNENIVAFRVHNASWGRAILKQFGHGSHGKIISDLILQSPKSVQCQFIAYWFAADGTIIDDHGLPRVRLESVSEQVLLDLKVMLLNMGITSVVQGRKTKCQGKEFYSYTLEIKRISVEKFVENIHIPGVKGTKIKYRHYNSRIVHNGIWEMTVKSVDFDGYEDTYGLTVKSGTYVTNGVISHNTPLVSYNLTAFEYIERRSARKSYFGEHWLSDEWYEKFKEHNVHFKVNGFRYSTFIEQSIIDLGRFATPLVYKYIIQKGQKIYSLRSLAYKEVDEVTGKESYPFVDALKAFINPNYFFAARDPEHYISPSHRIHIDLMGSYIPRARRLVKAIKGGSVFDNEMDIRCLKTAPDVKVKCYKYCVKNDPLKIYNDVEMDEEGNLHGDFRLLLGCERCNNPTEQKARLARKVYSTKNSDDLLAFHRLQKAVKVRFFINRKQDYDILNPNNTAYTVLSKFLQQSDNILHAYHSLDGHSMFWCCDPPVNYDVAGLMAVDTWWQYDVTEELQSVTSKVNQNLVASQCVGVRRIMNEEKVKLTDYNVIRFESTLPFDLFTDAVARYDGEIKVVGQGQGFSLEVVKNPNLRPPVVTALGKVVGYAIVPCRYNPFYYLQGALGVHKVSEIKLANSTLIRNVMIVRDSKNTVCKMCGKESGLISLSSDKILPFGKNCLSKVLLQREVNIRKKGN